MAAGAGPRSRRGGNIDRRSARARGRQLHQLLAKLAVEDITDVSAHGAPGTGADSTRNLALPTTSPSDAGSRATSQTVAHLAQWLHAETNGQPLYLVQMLRALLEQGVLAWEERDARDARDVSLPVGSHANMRWRLRVRMSPQEIANLGRLLPASMRAVIQQRLERLSAPTRSFLMAGAVLGTRSLGAGVGDSEPRRSKRT